jgi:ABC-type uncharacterized transport system involved in gliding motility auxiliary subunit
MKQKNKTLLQQLFNGVLIVAVIVLLGFLSVRFKTEIDWTANQRNTLTAASIKQLAAMPDPVTFHVFAPSGAEARRAVENDLQKYRRVKPDIAIEFIDPSASPQKVREYNIAYVGQVVIEYQGRRELLNATTEPAITTALQRLSVAGEQWVVFLEGHGERSTLEGTPASFSRFATALREKGLKVQPLSLIKEPRIPDNTSVLVIASPSSSLLAGEIELIRAYVEKGGNLLWLADPDYPAGLEPLAQSLGIQWQNGYAILPEYQVLGTGHPGFFVAVGYPPNPVTQGMDMVTLFPLARSLSFEKTGGWNQQPLLQTSEAAWLETGNIESGTVALDDQDIPGPLTIGLTLTRTLKGEAAAGEGETAPPATQRVALIGDADFLSDAYLGELGNQQLGLNLVQWLASRDAQLNVDVPKAPDTALYLPGWATMLIAIGFVLVLPLLLLGIGVTRWLVRRRK